jgi:hypothetical protein
MAEAYDDQKSEKMQLSIYSLEKRIIFEGPDVHKDDDNDDDDDDIQIRFIDTTYHFEK